MNQQSGMEADKEIDRFLQKVKKRDMRQKSILLLGMYALVGSILGFLVQCVAIWYPFYNCVPTSAAVFLGSIAVGGVHLFLCRTTTRRAARLADNRECRSVYRRASKAEEVPMNFVFCRE